jgi:hypothetical protein
MAYLSLTLYNTLLFGFLKQPDQHFCHLTWLQQNPGNPGFEEEFKIISRHSAFLFCL